MPYSGLPNRTFLHSLQMDARNLSIVFGPTLIRPQDESMLTGVKDVSDQCRVVETIILHVRHSHSYFYNHFNKY